MTAVNWDEPSSGSISSIDHALFLKNDAGPALAAASSGAAVSAISSQAEAVDAGTVNTLAGMRLQVRLSLGPSDRGVGRGSAAEVRILRRESRSAVAEQRGGGCPHR
jgi:hypothetical protein